MGNDQSEQFSHHCTLPVEKWPCCVTNSSLHTDLEKEESLRVVLWLLIKFKSLPDKIPVEIQIRKFWRISISPILPSDSLRQVYFHQTSAAHPSSVLLPCVPSCEVHTTAILTPSVKAPHRCSYGPVVQQVSPPNSFLPQCKVLVLLLAYRRVECRLFISSIRQTILNCLILSRKKSQTLIHPRSPLYPWPNKVLNLVHVLQGKYTGFVSAYQMYSFLNVASF